MRKGPPKATTADIPGFSCSSSGALTLPLRKKQQAPIVVVAPEAQAEDGSAGQQWDQRKKPHGLQPHPESL